MKTIKANRKSLLRNIRLSKKIMRGNLGYLCAMA